MFERCFQRQELVGQNCCTLETRLCLPFGPSTKNRDPLSASSKISMLMRIRDERLFRSKSWEMSLTISRKKSRSLAILSCRFNSSSMLVYLLGKESNGRISHSVWPTPKIRLPSEFFLSSDYPESDLRVWNPVSLHVWRFYTWAVWSSSWLACLVDWLSWEAGSGTVAFPWGCFVVGRVLIRSSLPLHRFCKQHAEILVFPLTKRELLSKVHLISI